MFCYSCDTFSLLFPALMVVVGVGTVYVLTRGLVYVNLPIPSPQSLNMLFLQLHLYLSVLTALIKVSVLSSKE